MLKAIFSLRKSILTQSGSSDASDKVRRNFALICLFLCAIHIGPASAQDRTFNTPRHNDIRLDWCLTWGADCGRPAALAFCNRRRFEDVVVFRAEHVGRSEPTSLIGTDQVCSGQDFCTAFAYITCTGQISNNRVFANPGWNGHRLDFCREWGVNCGKPAADAFCQSKGFSDAMNAVADRETGYSSTSLISSGQICDQPFCRGFQQIICR